MLPKLWKFLIKINFSMIFSIVSIFWNHLLIQGRVVCCKSVELVYWFTVRLLDNIDVKTSQLRLGSTSKMFYYWAFRLPLEPLQVSFLNCDLIFSFVIWLECWMTGTWVSDYNNWVWTIGIISKSFLHQWIHLQLAWTRQMDELIIQNSKGGFADFCFILIIITICLKCFCCNFLAASRRGFVISHGSIIAGDKRLFVE